MDSTSNNKGEAAKAKGTSQSSKQCETFYIKRTRDNSYFPVRTLVLSYEAGKQAKNYSPANGQGNGGDNPSPATDHKQHTISNNGGPIIANANIHLLFWWSQAWSSAANTPSVSAVFNAIDSMLNSPYMTELTQYGVSGAQVADVSIVDQNPHGFGSPPLYPNPNSSTFGNDCSNLISELINEGLLPNTTNAAGYNELFAFILPPGAGNTLHSNKYSGAHTFATAPSGDKMYYLWVSNDGTLDIVTIGFSHELVEACTDPDGNGIQINPRSNSNWNEIADICESEIATVNGVQVQKYWSKSTGACVVPTQPDNPVPNGANRLITVNAKFTINGALNTSAPNTDTFSFTRTIPLNNNQTTGEIVITTDKIVKNNLSANLVLSFTWHNDLSVSVKFTSAFFLGVNQVTSYSNTYSMGANGTEFYTVGHEINNNTDTCKITFNTLNGLA